MDNRFPCNYNGVYYKSRSQFCKEYAGKIGMAIRGLEDRFKFHPNLSIEEIISMDVGDNRFPCNYDGVYYKSRKQFCEEYAGKIGMAIRGLEDRFIRYPDLSIDEIISMGVGDNRFPCNYDGVYYKYRNHFCKEYASKIGMTVNGLRNRFIAHPNLSIEEIVSIEAQEKDKDNRFPCNYDGVYYKSRKQFCKEYASKIGMSASGLENRFKIHPDLSIEEIISMEVRDNRFPCNYDGVYYKSRKQFCKEYASKIRISAGGLENRFKAHPDLSIDFIVGKYPIIKSLISNIPSSQSIPNINIVEEVLPDLFKCEETINGEIIGTLRTKDQIFNLWKERKCGYWEFNE